MLESIGVASIEDLFKQIPEKARMSKLDLSKALSEAETQRSVKSLAKKNNTDYISFWAQELTTSLCRLAFLKLLTALNF